MNVTFVAVNSDDGANETQRTTDLNTAHQECDGKSGTYYYWYIAIILKAFKMTFLVSNRDDIFEINFRHNKTEQLSNEATWKTLKANNLNDNVSEYRDTCEISSSHGGEYDVQNCLLGCTAV
jgi:hypothetical protein